LLGCVEPIPHAVTIAEDGSYTVGYLEFAKDAIDMGLDGGRREAES
jgi:hypothetical protein